MVIFTCLYPFLVFVQKKLYLIMSAVSAGLPWVCNS